VACANCKDELAEKVRALRSSAAYPDQVAWVEVIETHFAWLFLVGGHAYKLKKPSGNPGVAGTAAPASLAAVGSDGRIVEGHGDLRPEHICIEDPPCVIDSLDFSRDLRILDPAEELAFLWIECEQAGGAWAAEQIFTAWKWQSTTRGARAPRPRVPGAARQN
jgi:aminoglycoside phosphotransferase family enzyme